MRAVVLKEAGVALIESIPDIDPSSHEILLRIRRIGLCGSDLNSFRGRNPMISFPRIPGHEVAATVMENPAGVSKILVTFDT